MRPSPLVSVLALAATLALPATPAGATLTFLGVSGDASSGRVSLMWIGAGVPDSSVDAYGMTPGTLYAGTTFGSSNSYMAPDYSFTLQGLSSLGVSAAGPADTNAAVARGTLWVYDAGYANAPARGVQSTLGVALHYQTASPVVYWEIHNLPDTSVPDPPPGPPGDLSMSHPLASPLVERTVGSVANTGVLDLNALLEAQRAAGQFSQWYFTWVFDVYLSDTPIVIDSVNAVAPSTPGALALAAPRPNPADGGAALDFTLAAPGHARLEILDLAGRHVRTVAEGDFPAGARSARWDARGDDGRAAAPGIYWARLSAAGSTRMRKLVLAR